MILRLQVSSCCAQLPNKEAWLHVKNLFRGKKYKFLKPEEGE